MDFMSIFEIPVAWIMVQVHNLLTFLGMPSGAGVAWVLSIVGLTIIVRILIMPLFFKQIKASRGMQIMQPELQALQKKYKGKTDPASRQAQQQEMMALYKKHNANPLSSCLPMLAQMPIFFGIFSVLRAVSEIAAGTYPKHGGVIGPLDQQFAQEITDSTFFGAPLSSWFLGADEFGDKAMNIRIVTGIMIAFMVTTQFLSMRMLTMKNLPDSAKEGPMYKQQRMMMYIFPFFFLISGVVFQIGLLVYWTVSNLWAMGQQFYTIRRQPAPGSEAYKAKQAREAAKRAKKGLPPTDDDTAATEEVQPTGQRVQPMGKARAKKKGQRGGAVEPTAEEILEERRKREEAEKAERDAEEAAKKAAEDDETDETPSGDEEVRGKDGLTAEERAQRRYEQRAAQREAARKKRLAAEKRRREEKGRYNKDGN